MGGTAVSAFVTVRLADAYGRAAPFVIVAVVLALYAAISAVALRDAPGRVPATGSVPRAHLGDGPVAGCRADVAALRGELRRFRRVQRLPATYLRNAYELTAEDAATRIAGFVVLAVLMRPVGGWLSDRVGPVPVLAASFAAAAAAALAVLAALHLPLLPLGTRAFLCLAAALGATFGATFALLAKLARRLQRTRRPPLAPLHRLPQQ
ncbi:MFS transporter [Pseudonocardia sp.]|jgi:NNP family nitrate/nitrite transporter-like MFS transporter|uniref:MFS transporter n=1 Tax=Pseudonocardia sp. TaxID=60912 RepID=UPI00263481EC|nr:MFS transporter [Pseudonocardia sp.]